MPDSPENQEIGGLPPAPQEVPEGLIPPPAAVPEQFGTNNPLEVARMIQEGQTPDAPPLSDQRLNVDPTLGRFGKERLVNDLEPIERGLQEITAGLDPRMVNLMEARIRGVLIPALDGMGISLEQRLASYGRSAQDPAKNEQDRMNFLAEVYGAESDYLNRRAQQGPGSSLRSGQFGVGPDIWGFIGNKMGRESGPTQPPNPVEYGQKAQQAERLAHDFTQQLGAPDKGIDINKRTTLGGTATPPPASGAGPQTGGR